MKNPINFFRSYFKKAALLAILFAPSLALGKTQQPGIKCDSSTDTCSYIPPSDGFISFILILLILISFSAIVWIFRRATKSGWSLKDALSEMVIISERKTSNGIPETKKEMRASSSRMIGAMGSVVILFMFAGFAVFTLYAYAITGKMPDNIDEILKFMGGGLTLFVPYVANKIASALDPK